MAALLSSAAYLTPLDLSQYVQVFDDEGYEKPAALKDMSIDELVGELQMKRGHARTLRQWLDERASGGGGGGGGGNGSGSDVVGRAIGSGSGGGSSQPSQPSKIGTYHIVISNCTPDDAHAIELREHLMGLNYVVFQQQTDRFSKDSSDWQVSSGIKTASCVSLYHVRRIMVN